MELKDFISQSLEQIARGIEDAGKSLEDSSAIVCPEKVVDVSSDKKYGAFQRKNGDYSSVSEIKFNVAVTVSEGTESKAGIGIAIGTIGIGTQGKSENENSSMSKLSFTILMVLPNTKE